MPTPHCHRAPPICRGRIVAFIVVGLLAALMPPPACAVGLRRLTIPADGAGPALSGFVWYPCSRAPSDIAVEPYRLSATRDCPIDGTGLPLIVISHGQAGNALGHHGTAERLAEEGFVAAAINHPGDTSQDRALTDTPYPFVTRPADIRRVVDYLTGGGLGAGTIDPRRVGLFGFSRGGYTGLVLAGADPQFRRANRSCDGRADPLCDRIRAGTLEPLARDSRIRAAVIADPLTIFFTAESLVRVRIPIQLWQSERGIPGIGPSGVAALVDQLPVRPDLRIVPGSQHFDFIGPCSERLAQIEPDACGDMPGFDRPAFYRAFNQEVLQFFLDKLR